MYTGNARGAGSDANVVFTLYGEKRKSDEFKLRNKTDNFENGKVDKLKVGWFALTLYKHIVLFSVTSLLIGRFSAPDPNVVSQ